MIYNRIRKYIAIYEKALEDADFIMKEEKVEVVKPARKRKAEEESLEETQPVKKRIIQDPNDELKIIEEKIKAVVAKEEKWLQDVEKWRNNYKNHPEYHQNHPQEQKYQKIRKIIQNRKKCLCKKRLKLVRRIAADDGLLIVY